VVTREQGGELPRLLDRALRSRADSAPAGPALLRFELARGEEVLGMLELSGERWRWRPATGAPVGLRLDASLSAALRAEAQRLLRR
jgi:hypothetical protein